MTPWGRESVDAEVTRVLGHLAQGTQLHGLESQHVDLKEEAGRRTGACIGPSVPQNEVAAKALAAAAACMANTDRGGVLIVGVGDWGEVIGTELEVHWLRHRIFVLTDRQLTVD
ncbi:MAG: RNA-binding domain-containing protein, partial [Angustibacter sp.]